MKLYRVVGRSYRVMSRITAQAGLARSGVDVRDVDSVEGLSLHSRLGKLLRPRLQRLVPNPFEVDGLTIHWNPGAMNIMEMALGVYEPGTTRFIQRFLQPGMTFVDVGAHVGWYTLRAARCVGDQGNVYSFEPYPPNTTMLAKNVTVNDFSEVVHVIEKAVSNRSGPLDLFLGGETGTNSVYRTTLTTEDSLRIEAVTLDEYFLGQENPPVHLVKMDIEGAEKDALEGMAETKRRNPSLRLILELVPEHLRKAHTDVAEMANVLHDIGFEEFHLITDPQGEAEPFDLVHGVQRLLSIQQTGRALPNVLCA